MNGFMRKHRREAGFTLLELLVALMLLGLISMLALGGVRLGVRSWETVGARAEAAGRVQMVRAFLRREISQISPRRLSGSGGPGEIAFEGDAESLTFVAPLAPHFGLGGLQRLRISLVADPGDPDRGRRLILTRRVYYPEDDFLETNDTEELHVLLDGIASAGFSYRGAGESDPVGDWSDDWRDRDGFPSAVRLSVDFADSVRADWPDLLAALRITAGAGCLGPRSGPGCSGG